MHFSVLFTHCPACGSERFVLHTIKSKHCENCGFVYYVNPSAAVASFIVNAKGDLLVCKRGKEPVKGTLDLPGGFVDEHESAEEAISREIREELQAKVFSARFLFTLPNEYEYGGMTIPTLDIFYECSLESNENLKPSDDVADCFFVPVKELNPQLFGLNSIRKAVGMFIDSHR